MTSVWGPLGWMTLHSISHNYPENPTPVEKQLVSQWIELFRDTITCPSCSGHFGDLLVIYASTYPYYLDSRREFMLFTYRAHNTVNRRLDKPIYHLVEECEEIFVRNLITRPTREYRIAYLTHIQRHWTMMRDMNGISKLRKVGEMNRIEQQYWSVRENLSSDLLGISVSPIIEKSVAPKSLHFGRPPGGGVSFIGGRLRFHK